jgi:uncharacterized coiled-coil protein SlyX
LKINIKLFFLNQISLQKTQIDELMTEANAAKNYHQNEVLRLEDQLKALKNEIKSLKNQLYNSKIESMLIDNDDNIANNQYKPLNNQVPY